MGRRSRSIGGGVVTSVYRVAQGLAERFGELDASMLAGRPAFRAALAQALQYLPESGVVDEVVALGHLAGARSPYGVVISRLRQLPELAAERVRLAEEIAEAQRWRLLDVAARRGETLRELVEAGDLFCDEAVGMLVGEFADEQLRATAVAALESLGS
jgi:hypothetical protein